MLKWMFSLLGIGVLLLGVAFSSVLYDRADAHVVGLSEEAMAQLTGGVQVKRASSASGTYNPNTLSCSIGQFPTGGCNASDVEERTYYRCVGCEPGVPRYSPTPSYWIRRRHECYTTPYGCAKTITTLATATVCHTQVGTCM